MVMTFLTELRLIRGMKVLMAFTTPTTLTLNESWRSFSRTEGSDSLERGNVRNHRLTRTFTQRKRTDGEGLRSAGLVPKVATHKSASVLRPLASETNAALLIR